MKIEYRVVALVDTKVAYPSTGKIYGLRNANINFEKLGDAEDWIANNGEKQFEYTVVKVFVPQKSNLFLQQSE